MTSIQCSFYAASIFILITQIAIAQASEPLSGEAFLNMDDGSLIVKFEEFNNLNSLNKPLQQTPNLPSVFIIDGQGTPQVMNPQSTPLIRQIKRGESVTDGPTEPKEICAKYPFVEGCNQ